MNNAIKHYRSKKAASIVKKTEISAFEKFIVLLISLTASNFWKIFSLLIFFISDRQVLE